MKRSLILLLVVALLATMAPTIALAAYNGTLEQFEVAMPDIYGDVSRSWAGFPHQVVVRWGNNQLIRSVVTGSADANSSWVQVVWTTSDRNIVGFNNPEDGLFGWTVDHDVATQVLDADGYTDFPLLDGRAVGTAVITGKAYWANDIVERQAAPLATVSFRVHCVPVWETAVTLDDPTDIDQKTGKPIEKTAQTHEYWLVDKVANPGDITNVTQIALAGNIVHGNPLEAYAHVHGDPNDEKDWENPNHRFATYGVSELTWTTSDESIARIDKHGRPWFTGKAGTVTFRATAKEEAAYPHTPKFAEITFIIHEKPVKEETSEEAFKKVEFTADKLNVPRGCSSDPLDGVNIARFLELYPRPVTQYQGSTDHDDWPGGNYGVKDDIVWSSSNENLIWICRDPAHYVNAGGPNDIGTQGPNWHTCYVEVSADAKPGDKVTIRATSRRNPDLYDEIVLVVVANDQRTVTFERTSVTVRESENVLVKVLGNDWTAGQLWSDRHVTLTSLNPDIARATMGSAGVTISGVEPGTTTITLESAVHKFKASIDVTVVPRNGVKSVTVPERYKNITMPLYDVGEKAEVDDNMNTTRVRVNINPTNAWYRATWTSSDPSVAYIVYDGDADYGEVPFGNVAVVRAAGVGKCKITVTINDGIKTFKRSMNITVVKAKATKLALNKTKATHYLIKGGDNTMQLVATDKRSGEEVPVTWKSSDKKIAKVNKNGLVSIKKEGTVTITATTKDGYNTQKTCTLTVKKLAVTKVKPAVKAFSMQAGEQATLKVTVKPAKAYNPALYFKSSNKKVVTVDADGNLKARKAGKAVITITAKDGSKKSAKVTITVKGTASNSEITIDNETAVGTENNIELTLDGVDGIDDLGNEDVVVLNANDVIELAID